MEINDELMIPFVETWRLTFKPGRYVKGKYDGR